MDLSDILKINYPVSENTLSDLYEHCTLIDIPKGEIIVEQGKRSNHLFFVSDGLFRVSFTHDGTEDTICFGQGGDPFMSLHSYYAKEPSQFSCIAMTNSKVYRITFPEFDMLLNRHIDLLQWMKNLLTEQLYALERRYVHFSSRDAYSRFVNFVGARPEIMEIIPAKYIAQYLNIRPETLYRLRARYLRGRQPEI